MPSILSSSWLPGAALSFPAKTTIPVDRLVTRPVIDSPSCIAVAGRSTAWTRKLLSMAIFLSAAMKSLTSLLRMSVSLDSALAVLLTTSAVSPLRVAAPRTWVMLAVTLPVLVETCSMLRAISCVAALCSSTESAMPVVISLISPTVFLIALNASEAAMVAACTAAICARMSSVAALVWRASDLTSLATTAKPLPASPARAASIVALRARRLVCLAILLMSSRTVPMLSAAARSSLTVSTAVRACCSAASAMREERETWRPIPAIEAESCCEAADLGVEIAFRHGAHRAAHARGRARDRADDDGDRNRDGESDAAGRQRDQPREARRAEMLEPGLQAFDLFLVLVGKALDGLAE